GNAVKHFLRWFARFGAFFDREIFRTNNSNLANCVFSRTKNASQRCLSGLRVPVASSTQGCALGYRI
ncbi:MAG TPA: hypothetical protein VFI31_23690, partial [Pirellulales bacterium]|nr:hypothetical protein [Pirellulales bacterium]